MRHEPQTRAISIYIVAAEESGDALGAALVRALKARHGGALTFNGVGGRAMAAAGIISPFAIDELSIMGIAAVPRRLPMIFRRIRQTAAAVVAARPDALVIIDSPDFTHRVARRVRRLAPKIPILDYVSPSIWAWRPGRARAMRAYVDQVLAILPFEPAVYVKLGGPPCLYVGHPMVEHIAELRPNAEEAQRRSVQILPSCSSCPEAVPAKSGICSEASAQRSSKLPRALARWSLCCRPCPISRRKCATAVAGWKIVPRIVVEPDEKWAAFRQARAALAASGTVTLEFALAGIPTVAAYRMSALECFIVVWLLRLLVDAAERHPGQSGPWRERHSGAFAVRCHAGTSCRGAAAAALRHPTAATPDRGLRPARCHYGHRRRGAERQGSGHRPRRGAKPWPARSGGAQRRVTAVLTADRMPLYHCAGHPAKAARTIPSETAKNPA